MRPGLIQVIIGVLLIVGGFLAPRVIPGIQWYGAFIVGAYFIIRGGYMMTQASRRG